jgi:hypothetical protein
MKIQSRLNISNLNYKQNVSIILAVHRYRYYSPHSRQAQPSNYKHLVRCCALPICLASARAYLDIKVGRKPHSP